MSKLPFTLKPKNTVSALSITPYFPFARVVPVDQQVFELATRVQSIVTLAPADASARAVASPNPDAPPATNAPAPSIRTAARLSPRANASRLVD